MTTKEFRRRQKELNEWADKAATTISFAACVIITVLWCGFLANVVFS